MSSNSELTFKEFKNNIINRKKRVFTKNSGRDAFHKWFCRHKDPKITYPIDRHLAGVIVGKVNKYLSEELLQGRDIEFPLSIGRVTLFKYKIKVRLKDGKIINKNPIDWNKTLQLWYEDEEAMQQKLKVKHETPRLYFIFRPQAEYHNHKYYAFRPHVKLRKDIYHKMMNNEIKIAE